ncbi:biotin/lipoyl-containing protein [Luteibaculum oceani]|uniref:Acetyl-CoA carboxylase biotin carboxyl carrier protein subunit n=1 Tax=Luteibaculum oceani TaxID=1294296 RepID=A0A5C6VIV5_9FLAO|nr:biotin/lipoyl-containing protein [Luteibaculum oceani]TXC85383.1 acetyl-CoA carboxylase biotin carboxyl carrier protein subunit [Luteibaculum oceani]
MLSTFGAREKAMYEIEINDKSYQVAPKSQKLNTGLINGNPYEIDFIKVKEGEYHLLYNNKSYNVELIKFLEDKKHMELLVNGNKYTVAVKDEFDALLENLGLDMSLGGAEKELKAPMPGLVVDVLVEVGQELKDGEPVLILEAMKMENVLKATGDVKVKSIEVTKGRAVEKNQVLVNFE